jgi:hypothetical protein
LTVTNTATVLVTVPLLGRSPTADFRVFDDAGRQIWSLLKGQIVLGALALHSFAAGEQLSLGALWDQRDDGGRMIGPGEYLIRGVLMTDDPSGISSALVRIRVASR